MSPYVLFLWNYWNSNYPNFHKSSMFIELPIDTKVQGNIYCAVTRDGHVNVYSWFRKFSIRHVQHWWRCVLFGYQNLHSPHSPNTFHQSCRRSPSHVIADAVDRNKSIVLESMISSCWQITISDIHPEESKIIGFWGSNSMYVSFQILF